MSLNDLACKCSMEIFLSTFYFVTNSPLNLTHINECKLCQSLVLMELFALRLTVLISHLNRHSQIQILSPPNSCVESAPYVPVSSVALVSIDKKFY